VLLSNADHARGLVARAATAITADPHGADCSCRRALDNALITAPAARDPAMVERLRVVAGRVLGAAKAPTAS
jgi:5'-methylthioadenosine phosphorylase